MQDHPIALSEHLPAHFPRFAHLAFQLDERPALTRRQLLRLTRQLISASSSRDADTLLARAKEASGDDLAAQLLWEMLNYRLDKLPAGLARGLVERRAQLLLILGHAHHKLDQKRQLALDHIQREIGWFSGWEVLCATSDEYQLREEQAWWHEELGALDGGSNGLSAQSERDLIARGFIKLPQQAYRERLREPLIHHLISVEFTPLLELAAMIHLYTGEIGKPAAREVFERRLQMVKAHKPRNKHTALPMRPLYSLPRESTNIYHLVITTEDALEVTESGAVRTERSATARAKLLDDQLLLFDTSLVLKRSGAPDAYMSVQLQQPEQDVLAALMAAIEQLKVDPQVLEHVPRIVAGMFTVAHRDRHLKLTHTGAFWDTESGRRLCQTVGFDPDNKRHRKRIQEARELLCKLILHRQVVTRGPRKTRVEAEWSGPIIQQLQDRLELKIEDREGLAEQQTFQSWLIARELWDMTQSQDKGGMPSFMLLDQRAFQLDESDSTPFNLYWALINRAYLASQTATKISRDGSFQVKLWTLCEWGGVLKDAVKVGRLKQSLCHALDRMVESQLLDGWECPDLKEEGVPLNKLKQESVLTVRFPSDQMEAFPRNARELPEGVDDLSDFLSP
jgi:hypothetical protein